MAIKSILFNTEMVREILGGRKSCTRRLQRNNIVSVTAWMPLPEPYKENEDEGQANT